MTLSPHTATLLDGKALAQSTTLALADTVAQFIAQHHVVPGLAVVQVGDVAASSVYVKKKAQQAKKLGISAQLLHLPSSTTQAELLTLLEQLNHDASVHAILVQLPLPPHLDALAVQEAIAPHKDVDGFHPLNLGKLLANGQPYAVACTPLGVMHLLAHYNIPLAGQHAVVIGRSTIVGKPQAHLLLQQHATVTLAHSRTTHLPALVQQADIVVAAVGIPELVRGSWLKQGAVVIDVGINRTAEGTLVGDVAYDEALPIASAITPVPGGVGPMTIAMLMHNTVALAQQALLA
jgi:methylenetetrahydrofolate dehydrogenase (NADP+)/methenyltetrahydrofolate cyclohydrolase